MITLETLIAVFLGYFMGMDLADRIGRWQAMRRFRRQGVYPGGAFIVPPVEPSEKSDLDKLNEEMLNFAREMLKHAKKDMPPPNKEPWE